MKFTCAKMSRQHVNIDTTIITYYEKPAHQVANQHGLSSLHLFTF